MHREKNIHDKSFVPTKSVRNKTNHSLDKCMVKKKITINLKMWAFFAYEGTKSHSYKSDKYTDFRQSLQKYTSV